MESIKTIRSLVLAIAVVSAIATSVAIFSNDGPGPYQYRSIRGQEVTIYGRGLYKDMSAGVAPQGIAQDVVTLVLGIPLLIISYIMARKGSLKGRFLLAGTLGYFLVSYLFYLVMGMYNMMFLAYVIVLAASFFAFLMTMKTFRLHTLSHSFNNVAPIRFSGIFLIFSCIAIAGLWLSIIIPPLLDGSIVPLQTEHYTTLIVQGLDLAILLPAGLTSGLLLLRKRPAGYLFAPVYLIFLTLLMTALTAKIVAMGLLGYNIIPVVFIIPTFNILAFICTVLLMNSIRERVLIIDED